jgi:hypothetical protein
LFPVQKCVEVLLGRIRISGAQSSGRLPAGGDSRGGTAYFHRRSGGTRQRFSDSTFEEEEQGKKKGARLEDQQRYLLSYVDQQKDEPFLNPHHCVGGKLKERNAEQIMLKEKKKKGGKNVI